MAGLTEFEMIGRLFAPLAASYPGALGLTDDAALVDVAPGHQLVVTKDAMVAGVHFLADDPPGLIARKLLRVNLSDLAAMGARPFAALMACAFPRGTTDDWLRAFADGLGEDCRAYGIALIGGDTVATPGPLTLSLTALGQVPAGTALRRSGARAGDLVWVSGTIGDGALGLAAVTGRLPGLAADHAAWLAGRYRLPEPRLALGLRLAGLASAAMDVSDGLVADLGHLCRASGLDAEIDAARVPLSAAAKAALAGDQEPLATLLAGGDDYELLFTAPEAAGVLNSLGLPVTAIGRMVEGSGVVRVLGPDGAALVLPATGWRHF